LRDEGHVKVDIILNRLKPRTTAFFGILSSLVGIFVSIMMAFYGMSATWNYYRRGIYTPTAMEIPVAAILLIIPIGSFFLLIEFVRRTGRFVGEYGIEKNQSTN
jgi:TRAP-type C4-dicarboxylate transport system permease small subunit